MPILLDDAGMPKDDELPDDIKKLIRRQAEFLQYRTFDTDIARVIKRLGLGQP